MSLGMLDLTIYHTHMYAASAHSWFQEILGQRVFRCNTWTQTRWARAWKPEPMRGENGYEHATWTQNTLGSSPRESKMGPGVLPRPKHSRLKRDSLNPWEVKVDSDTLPRAKHVKLGRVSPSLWEVKVGPSALPGSKYAGLVHDISSLQEVKVRRSWCAAKTQTHWARVRQLYEAKIGSGALLRPKHARLEHDSLSPRGVKMGPSALSRPKHMGSCMIGSSSSWVYAHLLSVHALANT